MMGGVLPETCCASYKYGIIKFWYIIAFCWIFFYEYFGRYLCLSHNYIWITACTTLVKYSISTLPWRSKNTDKNNLALIVYHSLLNPLNPELNPICYLLALLGAYHFLHVSRIRVKSLTLRLLMSYIYGAPILDVSRSHTTTQHSR